MSSLFALDTCRAEDVFTAPDVLTTDGSDFTTLISIPPFDDVS